MPGKYGTIPARHYIPAGQKPIALRCPPGHHAHAGYSYCHPEGREHHVAHAEVHDEHGRLQRVEQFMHNIGDEMYAMAKRGEKVPPKMQRDYQRLYAYVQRFKGTQRQLPINRAIRKDGGAGAAAAAGPGPGPMAPGDDFVVGSDVHVPVAEHRRRIRPSLHKMCGFAMLNLARCKAGDHKHGEFPCHPQERAHRRPKGMRCPNGQHKHDDIDCHPQQRKHRGLKKPEKPGRQKKPWDAPEGNPYGSPKAIKNQIRVITTEMYGHGAPAPERMQELREKYQELRDQYYAAKAWLHTPEGRAWKQEQAVRRAQAQGKKGQEHYEAKLEELEKKYALVGEQREWAYKQYRTLRDTPGISRDEWMDAYKRFEEKETERRKLGTAMKRARSYAAIGIARGWMDTIQKLTGGIKPEISAIRTGSKAYAHYSLETGIIGISDRALEMLRQVKANPDLLFGNPEADKMRARLAELRAEGKGKGLDPEYMRLLADLHDLERAGRAGNASSYAYAVSALFHEFLHSVNPAKGAYREGPLQWIEEGLTDAIANRMVARPEILGTLIGKDVDQGAHAEPGPKYKPWVDAMEYLAERAAKKHGTDPEWFLGKWKFHTAATIDRPGQMLDDAGIEDIGAWKEIFKGAREELPKLREQRQAQRVAQQNKAFTDAVSGAWWGSTPGFVFRAAGIDFDDSPETHSGGSQGGLGPAMYGGTGGPGMIDTGRHTSSPEGDPPKGEGFQKFPRGAMKCRECSDKV